MVGYLKHQITGFTRGILEYFGLSKLFTQPRLFVMARSNSEIRSWAVHNHIYAAYKSGFIVRLTRVQQLRGQTELMLAVLAGGKGLENYNELLEGLRDRVTLLLLGYNISNEVLNIISERSGMRSERY